MKKKIILMLLICFCLTGCTAVRINTDSIDNMLDVVLSKDNKLYNRVGKGYKYYLPRGITYIDSNEGNDKLYSNGNYYYLYLDEISYFYKSVQNYKVNKKAYYSKKIKNKEKIGYVEINKYSNGYLIEFVYNYAKIESLTSKDDINDVLLDASYILSTIKYNRNIVKLSLSNSILNNKEEKYYKYVSKTSDDNFKLKYSKKK